MDDNASRARQRGTAGRLDVEDEDDRMNRLKSTLEKLNASSVTPAQPPLFEFSNNSKPHFIAPPFDLLSRVQAFLPTLEASNAVLAQRMETDPKSVDIEHVESDIDQFIEMNLGLGVFEERSKVSPCSNSDQNTEMSSSTSSSSSDSSLESDDSDTDSSDESEAEIITSFKPFRPIKPLPKRRWTSPPIVVLGQADDVSG